jgi:hypothetical protein
MSLAPSNDLDTPAPPPHHRAAAQPVPTRPALSAPGWFEFGILALVAGTVCFGGAGLLLADIGHYSAAPALGIGAVLSVGCLFLLGTPRLPKVSGGTAPAIGMLLVAFLTLVWNAKYIAHHVWVERDPGVYAQTGEWLVHHNSLVVNGGTTWQDLGSDLTWNSSGMYGVGHGQLQFQFAHFLPALLAETHAIGGDGLMFRLPAVLGAIGLCAVYAVGCRLSRRPWVVLAAVTALGVSLPQISVSRDAFSETTTQIALWGGILLLLRTYERRRLGTALLAGLAIGATVMTRIDGVIYLLPLPVLAAICWLGSTRGPDRRGVTRLWGALLVGLVPPVALGTFDVQRRSTLYYDALRSQIVHLWAAFIALVVLSLLLVLLVPRLDAVRRWWSTRRSGIAVTACWVVGTLLVLAWSLRPAFQHSLGSSTATGPLEASEGLSINPLRTLSEQSLVWMSWYIGPVTLALAIVGICVLLGRSIRSGTWPPVVVLFMSAGVTAIYVYDPSITPDQIFAMRRFVPGALPLLVLSGAVAIEFVANLLGRVVRTGNVGRNVLYAGALGLVVFPLATSVPVGKYQPQAGYLGTLNKVCATIGPKAAVVFPNGDVYGNTMVQSIRSWCGVPAAQLTADSTDARIKQLADGWQTAGRTLWVLGATPATISAAAPSAKPGLLSSAINAHELETTVAYAPQDYTHELLAIYGVKIAP